MQAIEKENEEIANLANDFVKLVPEYRFSPAQLQDYFLLHKKCAKEAVDNVQAWMEKENLGKSITEEAKANETTKAGVESAPRSKGLMQKPGAARKFKQSATPSNLGLTSMSTDEKFHTPPQTPASAIAPGMAPEVPQKEDHHSGEPPSEDLENYDDDDTDSHDWRPSTFIPQETWDALQAEAEAHGRNFVPAR